MTKYTDMGCQERAEHHRDLVDEGFEWCPECGELLDWHPDTPSNVVAFRTPRPVVAGDYPPLSADDLMPIA